MGKRIANLGRRESMSIGCGDRIRVRRGFRAGLHKWCLGTFMAILLGLATILIAPAGSTLASITSTSPKPSAQIPSTGNTLLGNSGGRVIRNFQGTRGTNTTQGTKGGNAAGGARGRAAAPCVDKTKRYADCGNGTVTDSVTGLAWLKQSNCLSSADWEAAKKAVAGLKNGACMLTDGSSPGDWRLPTQKEWETTMEKALEMGCTGPTLTNDAGTGCLSAGPSSFTGVEADYYWSGTTLEGQDRAHFGDIDHGHVLNGAFTTSLRVWPVRGGQR
ncbi:MAG TPA: DUF1566 domain-containing protein [Terriglobia bacterium]|nr:DUF1566 domain-containing protein [Terriglobia bacterium]